MREYALFQAAGLGNGQLLSQMRNVVSNWSRRRKLHRLQDLDDHVLEDIGLDRNDITLALELPLSIDPVGELHRRAQRRRARGRRGR